MNREIKSFNMICYTLFLLLITSNMCKAEEDFDDTKQKRAVGNVGLFPFPRVGRSDPDMIAEWDSPLSYNSFENYDDLGRHEMKRQGLVPFPRVGRSGGLSARFYRQQAADYNKRMSGGISGANPSSSHMWFGPRLGKRAHDQENTVFVPRLGRSSGDAFNRHTLVESMLRELLTNKPISD